MDEETAFQNVGIGAAILCFVIRISFFNGELSPILNILSISALVFIIGIKRTFMFFFQWRNAKGTLCFFGGMLAFLSGWPVIGLLLESYGLFGNFSTFLIVAKRFLHRISSQDTAVKLNVLSDSSQLVEPAPASGRHSLPWQTDAQVLASVTAGQKFGVGFAGFGVASLIMGISSFDEKLMAKGNTLFVVGLLLALDLQRTFRFFFQLRTVVGTMLFTIGALTAFFKWLVIGLCIEGFGIFLHCTRFRLTVSDRASQQPASEEKRKWQNNSLIAECEEWQSVTHPLETVPSSKRSYCSPDASLDRLVEPPVRVDSRLLHTSNLERQNSQHLVDIEEIQAARHLERFRNSERAYRRRDSNLGQLVQSADRGGTPLQYRCQSKIFADLTTTEQTSRVLCLSTTTEQTSRVVRLSNFSGKQASQVLPDSLKFHKERTSVWLHARQETTSATHRAIFLAGYCSSVQSNRTRPIYLKEHSRQSSDHKGNDRCAATQLQWRRGRVPQL